MKSHFSNFEIYNFFKSNKRLLLTLIKESVLTIDHQIFASITTGKYLKSKYPEYFYPEIKVFINDDQLIKHFEELIPSGFEEKRETGENDSYLCQLIRNDSIEEFIIYVKKTNFLLSTTIETSLFETNSMLLKNEPTLIEYSSFFGSVQIFKYLYLNNVELTPSLWIFAVHGQNVELISLLEENHVEPSDKTFQEILKESIKCHHNDFTNFIEKNYLKDDFVTNFEENIFCYSFHYYNYLYFPSNFDDKFIFYYLCQYGYFTLVNFFLKTKKLDMNDTIISMKLFVYIIGHI